MIIDLENFRPQNESFEHFFLKQVGRAFLFNQGIRCIATEVEVGSGGERPSFGEPKVIIDVLGMDRRMKPDEGAKKLYQKIETCALEYGEKLGVVESHGQRKYWKYAYGTKSIEERAWIEQTKELCLEQACEQLGYASSLHRKLNHAYKEVFEMRGVEVKVSLSDFRNGFSMLPEYAYILAPKGIIPVSELPSKMGLLEFDFEQYQEKKNWSQALTIVKKPKKEYDSKFYVNISSKNISSKKVLDKDKHDEYCRQLLFTLAQQNTEEHIFWNPHITQLKEGYLHSSWDGTRFRYQIGEKTSKGIVTDRRLGKNPHPSPTFFSNDRDIDFYKLVVEGVGITKWMPRTEIEEIPWEKKTKKGYSK